MKTISNIELLKARKKSLSTEQALLEEKLRDDWSELSAMLKTGKAAGAGGETTGILPNLVKSGLRYGIGLLAGKLTGKAFRTLGKFL